jgi:hypothetical protein
MFQKSLQNAGREGGRAGQQRVRRIKARRMERLRAPDSNMIETPGRFVKKTAEIFRHHRGFW